MAGCGGGLVDPAFPLTRHHLPVRDEFTGLDQGLLTALTVFRLVALVWMGVVLVADRDQVGRPMVAVALFLLACIVTVVATIVFRRNPGLLLTPGAVLAELAVAAALLASDSTVYAVDHSQSLGSAWPITGAMAAGIAGGPLAGTLAGIGLGLARWAGHADDSVLSLVSSGVLYALAGGAQGLAASRLRHAEREIAQAHAREEVARTLHDGVLQTLAAVQRRASEPELVRLAHEQERELREWLFGSPAVRVTGAGGDLGAALRAVAARFEDRHPSARATVVVADDVPSLRAPVVDALAGAVGEALANAAKHGGAQRVTVYAEPDDGGGLFCTVKDDGDGFDAAAVEEGVGITRSIRARMTEVGGRAEVAGNPGRGTEVRLWIR